jgi:hypothetical protein
LKKKPNSKNNLVFSQKRCEYSLETTFVLRLFKILSAILRASASNIGKMTEKINFFSFFENFSKVQVLESKFWACSTRLIKLHKKKITFVMVRWKVCPENVNKNYFLKKNYDLLFFQKLALITKKYIHFSHFCSRFLGKLSTGP